MNAVAIITARGGSKRIPRKNIKPFLGKPILQYSVEAALSSGIFSEVMVSTEDEEIASVAEKAGAVVPFFRTEKTSNDYAATADVITEVLEMYEAQGKVFSHACCIYPTAPFLTPKRLREGMQLLEEQKVESVLPVVQFSFPPERSVVLKEGFLVPKWKDKMACRSQDLEPFYHDAGQFYCLDTQAFQKQRTVFMEKTLPIILSETEVQDIDTLEDWAMAELKYRMLREADRKSS